jgi:molybdate/tungstate transport system substrate-binding protein
VVVLVGGVAAGASAGRSATPVGGDVRVMYPAALTNLMEDWVRPAFERSSRSAFLGEGSGSLAMAQLIKDRIKAPDVFISSDASVDAALRGPANGSFVSWWVTLARSQLVVAWNPASTFGPLFTEVREELRTVESVLELPGLRLCRADPDLDPQGYQTLFALQLDQARSGQAGLSGVIFGSDHNPRQIFGAETLTTRLQSGACDAAFLYEAQVLDAALPFVTLPPALDLSDPAESPVYATASYVGPGGQRFAGAPITFTITIPATTRNAAGAVAFVRFLLGAGGQQVLSEQGLLPQPAAAGGDAAKVPAAIAPLLGTAAPTATSSPTSGASDAPTG